MALIVPPLKVVYVTTNVGSKLVWSLRPSVTVTVQLPATGDAIAAALYGVSPLTLAAVVTVANVEQMELPGPKRL